MDLDSRIYQCERDIKDIVDRLGKVEDKASGAWKTIGEINGRMDKIETKVDSLEKDVKELKAATQTSSTYIKWIARGLAVIGTVIIVAGIIALKSGSEIPEKVVETILPIISKSLAS